MQNIPTLRQMQYLLALNETRNFRQAAGLCHVTQPTLSAGIQEMETLMGQAVIDRSRRKKVVFTAFGLEVIETANKIMPPLEQLAEKAKYMDLPFSGPMRLGLIPTIAPYLLPNMLPDLQESFPNMDFKIAEDLTEGLIDKLHHGKIDIAIMAFPYETPGLNQKIFVEESFYCAAKTDTYGKEALHLNDLEQQDIMLLEDGHCLRDHAISACQLENVSNKKALSATSLQTLIHMVDQGYGITLLPEMVVKQGFIPKNVALHAFMDPPPSRKIGVVWRQKDPLEGNIHALTEKISEILGIYFEPIKS